MKVASGSYTGNGTTQDITDLGAAADFVLIKTGTTITQLWTSTMGAASRKPLTGATAVTATNSVTQHASGFTVGSDAAVNASAATHYWLAIQDNSVADFQVGSYVGDGANPRTLTLLDFDPNVVIIASAGADGACFRVSSMSGDASCLFSAGLAANIIESFVTNGWTVGNSSNVNNVDGRTYYYAAFKDVGNICKVLNDGSNRAYLGDGLDDRTITGAGFQPDAFALTKSASSVVGVARFKAHTGDQTADLDAGSAVATDRIQAFTADGFQVGTATRANANAVAFHAFVLKEGTSGAAPPSGLPLGTMSLLGVGR